MSEPSKDALFIAAANLTVAQMILSIPGPNDDSVCPDDPGKTVYEAFRAHLKTLEESYR
jgi:hypothetical protein